MDLGLPKGYQIPSERPTSRPCILQNFIIAMPQQKSKKSKKTRKSPSPLKEPKSQSKQASQLKESKLKRESSPLHHKYSNRLFQSVGANSFQNKKLKNVLSEKSEPKSSTQRDVSTAIFQEIRPNREYYGQQTSLYINNKCQSTSNLKFSKRLSKPKRQKNDKICKVLRNYRSLQASHSSQLSAHYPRASQTELHRLRRIQQSELRLQMQRLIQIQWKSLCR